MSKKTDARFSDSRRTKGSGNVFLDLDLGFDPAEAKVMAPRAEVMIRIEQHLKSMGWTQAETARRLGITQLPDVAESVGKAGPLKARGDCIWN